MAWMTDFAEVCEVRRFLWKEKRRVTCGVVFLIIAETVGLYLPMLNRRVFDEILPAKDLRGLLFLGGLVFALGGMEFISSSASQLLFGSAGERTTSHLRSAIFRKLTRISCRRYGELVKGDLHDVIMNDAKNLKALQLDMVVRVVTAVVVTGMTVALMVRLSVSLTVACLLLTGVISACALVLNKKVRGDSAAYTTYRSNLHSGIFDMLTFLPLIRSCCTEETESKRFQGLSTQLADSTVRLQQTVVLACGFVEAMYDLVPFAILIAGVFLMLRGQLLLGELLALSMYFGKLRGRVSVLLGVSRQWARCKPSLERIVTILRMPDENSQERPVLRGIAQDLEARNVTLTLRGVRILKGVSLGVTRGEMVAIVGRNGCGKTSLLNVLSGILAPDEGDVFVDGRPLRDFDKRSYRRLCGFVFQNAMSLNRTVRETVSYRSREACGDASIYGILQEVGLREFIEKLPHGLETSLGELSKNLSGGEMQRLAIAREIACRPQVLFLDEATASIDACGENEIFAWLKAYSRESRTSVVFVTHYLSTVRFADLAFVMDDGVIEDSGTPGELTRRCASFQRLFSEQAGKGDLDPDALP